MSDKAANAGPLKCTEASEAESLEGNRELSLNRTWIYQHGRFPPCDPGVSTVKAQLWLSVDPFSIAMLWLGKEEKRKDQKKNKTQQLFEFCCVVFVLSAACRPRACKCAFDQAGPSPSNGPSLGHSATIICLHQKKWTNCGSS